jgi:hypothetical protein
MPSWTPELEARLASLRLQPAREREIIDELSEHLELRYTELRNQGVDEREALALVRAELLHEGALAEFMRPLRQANTPPRPGPLGAPRRELFAGGPRMSISGFFESVGRAGTASLMEEIRQAIWSVNGSLPVAIEGTMEAPYAGSLARTSFTLVMLAIAGVMALALSVVGIYGVIAYVVTQRTREIGIRAALGADRRQLEGMFLRQGLTLAAVGAAIGLVAAAALGRSMSSLLFGVGPADPVAYLGALAVVMLGAALASYLPARRAAAINPLETLKVE